MSLTEEDHKTYLRLAITESQKSPPKPTNFRVGAVLVSPSKKDNPVLVTGYTLEMPGNTHAEQSCFIKLAALTMVPIVSGGVGGEPNNATTALEEALGLRMTGDEVLYTTMEPCNQRSVGNATCVDRILALKKEDGGQVVKKVVVGVREPEKFVGENEGRKRFEEAGIEVVLVEGFEEEILGIATAGHEKGPE